MTQRFQVHPQTPQVRLLRQAAALLNGSGAIAALPTDACYVLAWRLGDREALEQVRRIRDLDERHLMTLLCRDLSELSTFAQVDTRQFRFLKQWTPGPRTFVLPATREVPKRLLHPSRRTIGLRIPDHPVALGVLEALGEPLLGTTLQWPGESLPLSDPDEIAARLSRRVALVVDAGATGVEPTSVIDLTGDEPLVVRRRRGDLEGVARETV